MTSCHETKSNILLPKRCIFFQKQKVFGLFSDPVAVIVIFPIYAEKYKYLRLYPVDLNPINCNLLDCIPQIVGGIEVRKISILDIDPVDNLRGAIREVQINGIQVDGIQFEIFIFFDVYWKDWYQSDGITE